MNFLLQFYPGDKFVLMSTNVLLQVTVMIFMAWMLARFCFRRNAALRHNIWLYALILVLISPISAYIADAAGLKIFTISVPTASRPEPPAESSGKMLASRRAIAEQPTPILINQTFSTRIGNSEQVHSSKYIYGAALPRVPQAKPLHAIDQLRAIAVLASMVWCLGMLYLLIRLLQRGYALRRLFQTARIVDEDTQLRPVFAEIRRLLVTNRLPRVLTWCDDKIHITPFSAGVFRPVVVLSKNLLESLNHDELCDVLVHECAHVLRRDPLIGLLQRIAHIMFWPYPPVWLMNRDLARAREEVCDNYVLMHTDVCDTHRRFSIFPSEFTPFPQVWPKSDCSSTTGRWSSAWPDC